MADLDGAVHFPGVGLARERSGSSRIFLWRGHCRSLAAAKLARVVSSCASYRYHYHARHFCRLGDSVHPGDESSHGHDEMVATIYRPAARDRFPIHAVDSQYSAWAALPATVDSFLAVDPLS